LCLARERYCVRQKSEDDVTTIRRLWRHLWRGLTRRGPSLLGPGQTDRWWWWFQQGPELIVIQPISHNSGGELRFIDQSVERNLDGTTTYHISVINDGSASIEYHLLGEFLTQPA